MGAIRFIIAATLYLIAAGLYLTADYMFRAVAWLAPDPDPDVD